MSDMPVPETTSPILVNRQGDATRHVYDHTEEVPFVGPDRKPDGNAYAHFFKCTKTGAVQRYGCEATEGRA